MSASVNDLITDTRNAARPNSARVSTIRSAGAATLACDNLVGWPTASKVHFVTYRIDSNSNPVAGTQLDCYGIVSGNNITSFTVVDGTDAGNLVNDVVEMLPTAAWGQGLSDALGVGHDRLGVHKSGASYPSPVFSGTATGTYTLAGTPTLTSPTINTPTITSPTISGTITGAVVKNANLSTAAGEIGGTWTSYVGAMKDNGGTAPTYTASDVGKYIQVGKLVFVQFYKTNSAGGTAGSGAVALEYTLPIAADTTITAVATVPCGSGNLLNGAGAAVVTVHLANSTGVIFKQSATANSTNADQNNVTRQLYASFCYQAA